MNIYELLNSRSIAEHWKEINYQPDSLETAWLIYLSRKRTFKEKCKCWEEIIETMPDMEIPERANCRHYDSLHDFLYRFMAVSRRFLDWFNDNTDCVYTLEDADNDRPFDYAFSSVESIKEFIKTAEREDIGSFVIKKILVDDYPGYPARIKINKNFDIICQEDWNYGVFPCSEDEYDVLLAFEGMWFDFPVPFKKGDVIYNPYYKCGFDSCGPKTRPQLYVVQYVGMNYMKERKNRWFVKRISDHSTDMAFWGYAQWRNGTVFSEYFFNYMDFEFYHGAYKGKQRIIKALSNYEKGLIDAELLMHAYHLILSEERAKNDIPEFFIDKARELAGIKTDKNDGA